MKRWIAYILTPWMIYAQDLDVRTISRTNDTRNTTTKQLVSWYQGEKVQYDLWIRAGTNAMYVPGTATPIWYATDTTLTNYYLFLTGTVVSAAGGQVRFVLPSTLSGLAAATYESAVVIYDGSPTGQPPRLVGDRIQARVQWSPNYSGLYVGPFPRGTNYYIDENTIVLPNFWSQYEPDILAQLNLDTGTISAIQANNVLTSNSMLTAVGLVSSNLSGLGSTVATWQAKAQADLSFVSNRVDINSGAISTAQTDIVRAELTGTVAYAYAISVSNSLGASVAAAQAAADTAQATGVAAFVYAGSASATGVAAYALAGVASNLARQAYDTGQVVKARADDAYSLAGTAYGYAGQAHENITNVWSIAATGSNLAASAFTLAGQAYTIAEQGSNTAYAALVTGQLAYALAESSSNLARSAFGLATTARTIAVTASNLASSANVTATAGLATGQAAYALSGYLSEGSISIRIVSNDSPGYFALSNSLASQVAYLQPFNAEDGHVLSFDASNKRWEPRSLYYAQNATNSDALGGLPAASYLTLVAFQSTQTNYARFLSSAVAPATPTNTGINGEIRVDVTNLYLYVARSNRWLRIPGSFSW